MKTTMPFRSPDRPGEDAAMYHVSHSIPEGHADLPSGDSANPADFRIELEQLRAENRCLKERLDSKITYIRGKVNQLLTVMGTLPLRPEELDDETLVELDPIGILSDSFSQMISHIHKTNRELEEGRAFLQTIFSSVEAGIVLIREEDHVIVDVNPSAARVIGLPREEIIGQPCFRFLASNCDAQCPMKDGELCSDNAERLLITGEGQEIPVIKTVVRVLFNGTPHFLESFVDISAMKQAEKALAAEKEQLSVTLRSIADGVITTDSEGMVLLVNKTAERLTGWSQEEAQGRSIKDVYRTVDEKTGICCCEQAWQMLSIGDSVAIDRAILTRRSGECLPVSCNAAPICDSQSRVVGSVVVFRDLTQQRRMEAEALRSQKLESVGVLAGGIAHDFNNLLTSILGNLSLARLYVCPGEAALDRINDAERASLRARDLTQQLLTFSKGGAPVKKTASIVDILNDSTSFALRGSNVRYRIEVPQDLWAAELDEGQISQVIHNLVLNADQAMAEGGEIIVSADNCTIPTNARINLQPGKYICISVKDTGIGIPVEILPHIFDPYFTTKEKGSGLGLASSYSIVSNHAGTISVVSVPGSGSTFQVYLPASADAPEAIAETEGALVSGKGRILVMDDDEIVRDVLSHMLAHLGYSPELAVNGTEAIECYLRAKEKGEPFAAVIMDLTIPGGMGGREAMSRLLEFDPNARGIVSSGYSTDPIMADYRSYGFSGVVAKPFRVEELSDVLENVVVATP